MTAEEFAQRLQASASSGVPLKQLARELDEGRQRIGRPAREIFAAWQRNAQRL